MQVRPLPHAAGGRLVRALVLRGHRGGGQPGPLAVRLLVLTVTTDKTRAILVLDIFGGILSLVSSLSLSYVSERKPRPVLISVL